LKEANETKHVRNQNTEEENSVLNLDEWMHCSVLNVLIYNGFLPY